MNLSEDSSPERLTTRELVNLASEDRSPECLARLTTRELVNLASDPIPRSLADDAALLMELSKRSRLRKRKRETSVEPTSGE